MTKESKDHAHGRAIHRLLRRRDSQDYFTGSGWSTDIEAAKIFRDSLEAARACAHCGLVDVEMVLRIAGGSADLYCTPLR